MTAMTTNSKDASGFTIVELLIVVVVIAILASISLVSYIGIQNRARASGAATNAASVRKVAEFYYAENNVFPTTRAQFTGGIVTLPSSVTILPSGSLTSANGESSIMYRYVGTAPNATGACVLYWDFAPTTGSPRVSAATLLGTATTANCSATVGTFPS